MTGVLKRKLLLPLAITAAAVLAGIPAVAQFGSSAPVQAASLSQPAQPARCSLATLKGAYVFSHSGVQVTGSTKGPLAAVGTVVFDGRGHARGAVSESLNGKSGRHVFTNTYTLNPDCTGTIMVTDVTGAVRHYDMYTSSSGSRYTFLRTDPGVVESGIAEKR